jgi:tRNA uridine 5-carboxymethylaminomethyl modification enzyme
LIDDLISKGTEEPYRMFTSRAEFRTLLRQDNADLRLTPLSHQIGLAKQDRMDRVNSKIENVTRIKSILQEISIDPIEALPLLENYNSAPLNQKVKAISVLLRPNIELTKMIKYIPRMKSALGSFDRLSIEQAEIQIKYDVYIEKEKDLVKKMGQLEDLNIPETFNYDKVAALSNEALQKFKKIKPRTLGQASRISGVNPSDIQILMVYMGR